LDHEGIVSRLAQQFQCLTGFTAAWIVIDGDVHGLLLNVQGPQRPSSGKTIFSSSVSWLPFCSKLTEIASSSTVTYLRITASSSCCMVGRYDGWLREARSWATRTCRRCLATDAV